MLLFFFCFVFWKKIQANTTFDQQKQKQQKHCQETIVTRNEQHRYAKTTSPVLLRISLVFLLKAGSPVQKCGRLPVQNQNNWVDEINTAIQGDVSRITEISL